MATQHSEISAGVIEMC